MGGTIYVMKKYLCIDYGRVRIGLAVSYDTLAEPLKIFGNSEDTIEFLQEIIAEEAVDAIVVGISDREMAEETKSFVQKLKEKVSLPIDFIDESFSSKIVQKKMIEANVKQSKRQQPIDHFAAAHILQEYLDTIQSI